MQRLNTRQALAMLGWTHRNTLYKAVRRGVIKQHKDSPKGRNYYLRSELEAYINRDADDGFHMSDAQPQPTVVQVEFLTPAQAQTLLGIGKTQFYKTIQLARPPVVGVTLPGMTEPRFRRADLLSLPDRVPGSAIKSGLPVASWNPECSIYEWRQSARMADEIRRGDGHEKDGKWVPPLPD